MSRCEDPATIDPRETWNGSQWREETKSWNDTRRTIALFVSIDLRKANGNEEKLSRRLKLREGSQSAFDDETREFMLGIVGLSDKAFKKMCESLGVTSDKYVTRPNSWNLIR
ncbi:hypothetical protein A3A60_04145 [Candidatus Curtissbacteria bacterium RIFCSPLOWO2_01_FULL_42_26]|uniref:Uncharacterized protein n=1 Tax=Candidatus Curtissbacteria bacterium RIFCSPLOWO2_01_FULL_42_26 TaxID=1797729 RepID=A0A1F5HZ90_9BACT|nr:MAG: hypothetical protein A3A60_04145 [Candidatus Curtissbacteria bacterium RIFCSPLOWO2_01_FULL_42_26]